MAFDNFKKGIRKKEAMKKNLEPEFGESLESQLNFLKIDDTKKKINKRIMKKVHKKKAMQNIFSLVNELER